MTLLLRKAANPRSHLGAVIISARSAKKQILKYSYGMTAVLYTTSYCM